MCQDAFFHVPMAGVVVLPRQLTGEVGWYVGHADNKLAAVFAQGDLPIVLSGGAGAETGRRLRAEGFSGELLIDPCEYESPPAPSNGVVLFDAAIDWEYLQRIGGATALLSQGATCHRMTATRCVLRCRPDMTGHRLVLALRSSSLFIGGGSPVADHDN